MKTLLRYKKDYYIQKVGDVLADAKKQYEWVKVW